MSNGIKPARHRTLLNKTLGFDGDDYSFLVEAAAHHDKEVILHCSKHGLQPDGYCLEAAMTAKASMNERFTFAEYMMAHGLKEGIGSMCAEALIQQKDTPALLFLLENRRLSTGALRQIINCACQ